MNKQLFAFSINRALFELAFNIGSVFGIVFLYSLFDNSITAALGNLAVSNILYGLFITIFTKQLGKIGVRNSMIIGILIFAISFLVLGSINEGNKVVFFLIWLILFSIARAFYNIPFHYFIIKFTEAKHRGDSLGKFRAISILFSMIMPLLGGLISNTWGLTGMAFFAAIVFFASILPLLSLPNFKYTFTGYSLNLLKLKSTRRELKLLLINDGQNKEQFWNLYVFIILQGSFINFGILLSVVNVLSFAFSWTFGKFIDKWNRLKILKVDGIITSIVWFSRLLITNPVAVTINNTINQLTKDSRTQVITVIDYDLINRTGKENLLEEKLFVRELVSNLISGVIIAVLVLLAIFVGWPAVFIFSGLAALITLFF